MKNSAKIGSVLALTVVLLTGSSAYAHTGTTTPKTGTAKFFSKLHINGLGKTNIVGSVTAVSATGFTVASQGGSWTIKTDSNTHFTVKNGANQVKVGDTVMVYGTVSTTETMTIVASKIENKTLKTTMKLEKKAAHENKKEIKQSLKELKKHMLSLFSFGTVQSVGTNSLTLKSQNGATYDIKTSSTTETYKKDWTATSTSAIKANHQIHVYGTKTGTTTIDASIIHDLSL
ncbi:MAG: DUF5666 domain-containing protein [Patescibacteria group bacterium]